MATLYIPLHVNAEYLVKGRSCDMIFMETNIFTLGMPTLISPKYERG